MTASGRLRPALALFAAALLCSAAQAADWWQVQPTSMPVHPAAGDEVLQNPPVLSWPNLDSARGYEVRLQSASGEKRWLSPRNAVLPDAPLALGRHRWSVRVAGVAAAPPGAWSEVREFVVTAAAQPFVLPPLDTVWSRVSGLPHPRGQPAGAERAEAVRQALGPRKAETAALRAALKPLLGVAAMREPATSVDRTAMDADKMAQIGEVRNELTLEAERILNLGWLWMVDGDEVWVDEAQRRVLNLAGWNPRGTTGLVGHDQATRSVLLALAVGYDLFHDRLTPPQRSLLLGAIRSRGDDLYQRVVASKSMQRNPNDAWGGFSLNFLVAVAPLVAGDLPEAQAWWMETLPLYAAIYPAWSGDDGGFGNGSNYGLLGVPESLPFWSLLRWSTGIDFMAKPAVRNYERVLAWFFPPGAPVGVFGDGAETPVPAFGPRHARAFATRVGSPLMQWYAAQFVADPRVRYTQVSSPAAVPGAPLPTGTPDHLWLRSIGWVAMHSSLADRHRTSVYFKSSPFGSLNHSHADQNSFVVHADGQVLLADSGHYDYYGSPHYLGWYKQTKAHNAVTFDGGIGQQTGPNGLGSKAHVGQVDGVDSGPGWVRVQGQAASAYGGDVTRASRTLVHLKPDLIVVHDVLQAVSAKRWEFNLQGTTAWSATATGWRTGSGAAGVCADVRASAPLEFEASPAMLPAPVIGKAAPNWRGVWALDAPAARAEFVSVLRIGCTAAALPPPAADLRDFQLSHGGLRVRMGASGLEVVPE